LRSHCGAQRFAFNWGLRSIKANLNQRAAELSYGVAESELTPRLDWSAYGLRKAWNGVKDHIAPWWPPENSKEAYASGLANLASALRNWALSQSGDRKGRPARFPRFKTKKSAMSCRFTTGAFGLADADRRHVRLPRVGTVRTHESTRKMARRIDAGNARIRSATVTFTRGRWFVSFSVEVQSPCSIAAGPQGVVGVDLGVKHLAVLSAPVPSVSDQRGMVANPRHLEHAQRRLSRLHRRCARRRGPDKKTNTAPSKRWRRTRGEVAHLHATIANQRENALHLSAHVCTDRTLWCDRYRGSPSRRLGPQRSSGPPNRYRRVGRNTSATVLQDIVARRFSGRRGTVLPQF
jgi:putative transposase